MSRLETPTRGEASPTPDREQVGSAPPERSPAQAAAQLGLVLLVVVIAAVVTHTTALLVVIVALVIMVMLHELGHFATAKWSGMKVTEYFLGFGPHLWSVRKGETEYGVKAVPAGGYVKIIGMSNLDEVDPADEPRTYRQQPTRNRVLVAVAGSAMHALMALVLIWVLLAMVGLPKGVEVAGYAPLSNRSDPARTAGIRSGDVIVAINGKQVNGDGDTLTRIIGDHAGTPVTLELWRNGQIHNIVVTPQAESFAKSKAAGSGHAPPGHIGVELQPAVRGPTQRTSPLSAVGDTFTTFGRWVSASVGALGQIFSAHGLSQYYHDLTSAKAATASEHSSTRIQSIVGATRTAVQGAQSGVAELLVVLISINIFVGMINLLPMLPLDGGHVAIALYERIRSRRGRYYHADVRKLLPVATAFVVFLGFIVVSALYLDITHPLANPFH